MSGQSKLICMAGLGYLGMGKGEVEPQDFTPQTTVQDNIPHGRKQLKPRKINTSSFKSKTVCQKINSYEHLNMSGNLRHSTLCKRSKSHLCKVCGKSYTTKGSLLLHTNIHKGQRFNCKKCGMTFTYKSNLRSHLLRHLGFMLFKCETCGKNFNQNSNLTRHKMIHEEEVLFKCRWCAKSFTQNSYLETHSRFKAFKCEECGMNFALKSHLKCHSLKHSKQLLFVCEVCGKSFNQKRYLTMHKLQWMKVSKEFNAIAGVVPSVLDQLKRFWDKQKAIYLLQRTGHPEAACVGAPRNSVVGEEIIAQDSIKRSVDCRNSDFFHQQYANLSRVSTATVNPVPATATTITHPVSFPAPVTSATLVSFDTFPPVSPPMPIQIFRLSQPPISLPALERVPSGSSSQQIQWFPTAEEKCFNTPISVGSVQRRHASNSARLGEEMRVRLDKSRGGLEAQTEHEQLKLDYIKWILQLKLEKKLEILELRLHNERERNCVAARYEELHNITVQNLHAARSRQETVNQVLLENESWLSGSWNSTH
uniref:C2H2-type domain-containing protein n=1 Tax=Timema poppense TaxID=170557 RepID=A0A7R9D419_TIMPO|nr:unnamed protein product [Timema poppensis]